MIEVSKGGYAAVFRACDAVSEPLATPRAEVAAVISADGASTHPMEIPSNAVELPSGPGKADLDPVRLWRTRWWSIKSWHASSLGSCLCLYPDAPR